MADVRDQRVRLLVVTTVATAAGVGLLSSLWLQHRRRVSTFGVFSGSTAGYSTEAASGPDRADSTQPVNSRWAARSRRTDGILPAPAIAEVVPSPDGEQSPVSSPAQPETWKQDSSAEHKWVAFESTGQLAAAAAAAAAPLGSDGNISEPEVGGDATTGSVGSQPQQVVLPPEDSAARAQARSNLASIYSTVGASLPPKQRPQNGLPQRSPSGTLPAPKQPPFRANGAQLSSAPVPGFAGRSPDVVASALPVNGPSSKAPRDGDSAERSAAVPLPGAGTEENGAALPLWQRLLALTAAGVDADDERDDERDNNDTDAGPHEVSISVGCIAGSAADRPERQAEQQPDAPSASESLRPSMARLPPMFPRPKEPTHVEDGLDARPLV